jgi:hypothetical protein
LTIDDPAISKTNQTPNVRTEDSMSLRKSPRRALAVVEAGRASAAPTTTTITDERPRKVIRQPNAMENLQTTQRQFGRLPGGPEAIALKPEPGAAIHLYKELIAPYEPAPPALLSMHFRDLARLQLELEAWEGIRDAEMEHRAQQSELEIRRRQREVDRELEPVVTDVFETGLSRMADSLARVKDQHESLLALKLYLRRREFAAMDPVLRRLYGKGLHPDHERGQIICIQCRTCMKAEDPYCLSDEQLNQLIGLVEAEERDTLEAQEIALSERQVSIAAAKARLALTRDDHWMNRQRDRLRQAIDRKMRFTPALLQVLGLARSSRLKRRRSPRKISPLRSQPASASPLK